MEPDPTNTSNQDRRVERVLQALKQEYVVVGKTRVRTWHAWLLIGIAAGIAAGIILVANRSGEVEEGRAAEPEEEYQLAPNSSFQFRDGPESKIVREASLSATALLSEIGKASEAAKPSLIAELRKVLQNRRKVLEALIEKDPVTALLSFFPPTVISKLPPEVQGEAEQPVTIEGTIEVFHTDDFQNRVASYQYFLKRGNTRLEFHPAGAPLLVSSGAKVRVDGFKLGNQVVAPIADNTFRILAASPPPDSIGDQRTLAVLIDFLDSPQPPPFSVTQGPALIFQGQMQAFYKEASYDQISWSGDVIGWYTVPRNGVKTNDVGSWPYLGDDTGDPDGIYGYIKSKGIDITQYQRVVLLPHHPDLHGGKSSLGKVEKVFSGESHRLSIAYIGDVAAYNQSPSQQPFPWTWLDEVLAHELGHGLGLLHAGSWECGVGKILYGAQCFHIDPGNYFDVMATGLTLHFNAYYKDVLGWAKQAVTISKSGTYTINVFEIPSAAPLAKIYQPVFNLAPYFVEYRRAAGFDARIADPSTAANQNGIFVNWAPPMISAPFSRLLDMSPKAAIDPSPAENQKDWSDVALYRGKRPFTDVGNGIVIGPVLRQDRSSITFRVQILPPKCIQHELAATVSPWSGHIPVNIAPGGTSGFSIFVQNLDSYECGPSDIQASVALPAGWTLTSTFPLQPVSVSPFGGSGWLFGEIQVPSSAVSGSQYSVPFTVTNTASGKNVVIPIAYIVQ